MNLKTKRNVGALAAFSAAAFILFAPAEARVTQLAISERESPTYGGQSFGSAGQFEKLTGTIAGELDPSDRRNAVIQDIDLAPRNDRGMVEYVATFTLIKPIDSSKANGGLLYQVVNRGNRGEAYNWGNPGQAYVRGGESGDGFVQKLGYTLLWSGWQGDLPPVSDGSKETIRVPVAKNRDGAAITGPVLGRFVNVSGNTSQIIVFNAPIAYRPATLDTATATLVRNAPESPAGVISGSVTKIPGDRWAWADCRTVPFPGTPDPTRVCLKDGFDSGEAYTLVYTAADPLVLGIGFAATRDINAFFRRATADNFKTSNPVAGTISFVLAEGTSQSGNFVKTFIHLGFNEDESGKVVWDGADAHIAARQNPTNFRFANPGGDASLYSPGSEAVLWWDGFPDRARGRKTAGMLDRCRSTGTCPKIFETNGSAEFWNLRLSPGYVGTSASSDIPLPSNVRRYYFPSTTHGGGLGGFATSLGPAAASVAGLCILPANPNPEVDQLRALLVDLKDWVVSDKLPPPSSYPRLSDRTLVPATEAALHFPRIPGVPSPDGLVNPMLDYDFGPAFNHNDLRGVISNQPPVIKQVLPTLVPEVDVDGNEVAGVKSVLAQAPLATYLGWNIVAAGLYKGQICSFVGGAVQLATTRAERLRTGDPRLSLEERYRDKAGYIGRVRAAAERLVSERLLLREDADRLVSEAQASDVFAEGALKGNTAPNTGSVP